MRAAMAGTALGLLFAAGCGGSDDVASAPLRDGVYEYELTQQYLLDNGISQFQAESESGRHRTTLDGKDFVDAWTTAEGRTGSCRGTFEADGDARRVQVDERLLGRLGDAVPGRGQVRHLERRGGTSAVRHGRGPEGHRSVQRRPVDANRQHAEGGLR